MLDLFMCLVFNLRRDQMDLGPKTGSSAANLHLF